MNEIPIEELDQVNLCLLCYSPFDQVQVFACLHKYCQKCVEALILQKINEYRMVQCPLCFSELKEQSKSFLNLTDKQKFIYRKIKFAKDLDSHPEKKACPNESCEFGFLELINKDQLECNACKQKFCQRCREKLHLGKKCEQDVAKQLKRNFRFIRCQKCLKVIQRINGCKHMTCNCGNSFCYSCGRDWNAGHQCPAFTSQELVCVKLQNYLASRAESIKSNSRIGSFFLKGFLKIIYLILIFLWISCCLVIGVITFVVLIPAYLVRGNYIFLKQFGRNCRSLSKRQKMFILLWVVFLPISIFVLAIIVLYVDTKRGTNRFIFRICFTLSIFQE